MEKDMEQLFEFLNSEAAKTAGYREMYAIKHGTPEMVMFGGERCVKYTYSDSEPYQDANGALWSYDQNKWIN